MTDQKRGFFVRDRQWEQHSCHPCFAMWLLLQGFNWLCDPKLWDALPSTLVIRGFMAGGYQNSTCVRGLTRLCILWQGITGKCGAGLMEWKTRCAWMTVHCVLKYNISEESFQYPIRTSLPLTTYFDRSAGGVSGCLEEPLLPGFAFAVDLGREKAIKAL